MTVGRHILWFDEIEKQDALAVGGKAMNLARLRRARLNVPNGFVLTTAAFDEVEHDVIPKHVGVELIEAYGRLGAAEVAVRSSATLEDSPTASFAGQGRTILNVKTGDELGAAVSEVRRSMDMPAARDYACRIGVDPDAVDMAVIVQEMVDAELSGVLFTRNPVSGDREEMVVNATWGLGEPLVAGKVAPDEVVIDRATGGWKSTSIGSKEYTLVGSRLNRRDPDRAKVLCVDQELTDRLVEVGRCLEDHFGQPQDVEWAWREELYVLQTRPLTATGVGQASSLPGRQDPCSTCPDADALLQQEIERIQSQPGARRKIWVAKGMAEMLPCPTPLSWDVASRFMSGREGYGLGQRYLGFDPAPLTILERIAGHVYVDLDRECGLFFRHAPIGPCVTDIRRNPLSATMPRQVVDWRKLRPGFLVRWPLLVVQVIRFFRKVRRHRRDFLPFFQQHFLPQFESYLQTERAKDLSIVSENALAGLFNQRLDHFLTRSSPILTAGSILAAMSYRELEDLLIDRLGAEGAELAGQLTTGLQPNPTLDLHQAVHAVFHGATSLDDFVRRFGHRCGREFELAAPRWRENREALRVQVEQLKDADPSEDPASRSQSSRRAAEAKLDGLETQWGPIARELIGSRLLVARKLFPLREQAKDLLMREYELLRTPLVELDRRLGLDDGVFYLHSGEIQAAVDGRPVGDLIDERRRQHALQQQLRLPQVILGSRVEGLRGQREAATAGTLRGVGVSPGVACGPVRVVSSSDDLAAVEPGDVVVVGSLEPAWTIAFTRAAALVAERGATLSHGAIVAREFGVPAVVNVAGCTTQLRTGQVVQVDGAKGFVVPLSLRPLGGGAARGGTIGSG